MRLSKEQIETVLNRILPKLRTTLLDSTIVEIISKHLSENDVEIFKQTLDEKCKDANEKTLFLLQTILSSQNGALIMELSEFFTEQQLLFQELSTSFRKIAKSVECEPCIVNQCQEAVSSTSRDNYEDINTSAKISPDGGEQVTVLQEGKSCESIHQNKTSKTFLLCENTESPCFPFPNSANIFEQPLNDEHMRVLNKHFIQGMHTLAVSKKGIVRINWDAQRNTTPMSYRDNWQLMMESSSLTCQLPLPPLLLPPELGSWLIHLRLKQSDGCLVLMGGLAAHEINKIARYCESIDFPKVHMQIAILIGDVVKWMKDDYFFLTSKENNILWVITKECKGTSAMPCVVLKLLPF